MPAALSPAETAGAGTAGGGAGAPRRAGLARTLFVRIFPVIGVVVLLTQLGIAWINHDDQMRVHTERADLLVTLTADAIARPVWNLDENVYRPQIRALGRDSAFQAVRLVDDAGVILVQIGEPDEAEPGSSITVSAELRTPDAPRSVGQLTLVLSTEDLWASAGRQVALAVAAFVILMLAFMLTLHANVQRHVMAPVKRLLHAMGKVEHKRWATVEAADSDELGSVACAFNRMVDGLRSGDEAKQLLARLETAHRELEYANGLVLESIGYARRIQTSMLPDTRALAGSGLDVAVLWEPLHQVGGDYFWFEQFDDCTVLVVADCTGHGVPGAFLTLVVATALDRLLHERALRSPAEILTELDKMVRARLRQDGHDAGSDDGLDCGICIWRRDDRTVRFAGAGLALTVVRGGEATRIKGEKRSLGYRPTRRAAPAFRDVTVSAEPGASFYLMTDGVCDQMGGAPKRLFGHGAVARLLARHAAAPLAEQIAALTEALDAYRAGEDRRDDMTLIAFRPQEG